MPSDVPVFIAHAATTSQPSRRLPIGVGLSIGACASIALWAAIVIGLRTLFS